MESEGRDMEGEGQMGDDGMDGMGGMGNMSGMSMMGGMDGSAGGMMPIANGGVRKSHAGYIVFLACFFSQA